MDRQVNSIHVKDTGRTEAPANGMRNTAAFTLLEVVLAVAVSAFVLTAATAYLISVIDIWNAREDRHFFSRIMSTASRNSSPPHSVLPATRSVPHLAAPGRPMGRMDRTPQTMRAMNPNWKSTRAPEVPPTVRIRHPPQRLAEVSSRAPKPPSAGSPFQGQPASISPYSRSH